ncbi:ankyrin repeat-containing protein At5g02620-like [Miscanthus floridulus]|uniref:ankyrin repeat-containing protein At5g02620-like n=1 Tax=Miscanthus floridulus TaxID=154761 RepID=UPI00345A149F
MGHHRVVKDMLRIYPDAAELRDGNGGTFQHTACREKQSSVVPVVIKSRTLRGLLLDAQDRDGNTALHLAVAAGAPAVVEALLQKGEAQTDVLNSDGDTAFDLAAASTSSFTMVRLVVTLVAYGVRLRPKRQDQLAPLSGHDVVQGIERTSDSLAVVAVLIATSAFAAGFNVPGGYSDATGQAHLAGKLFFDTLFLDMFAVATSVVAMILLVYGKTSRSAVSSFKSFAWALQCMWVSLMTLMLAFYVALVAVVTTSAVSQYGFMAIEACICALQICLTTWIIRPAKTWRTIWRYIRQEVPLKEGM